MQQRTRRTSPGRPSRIRRLFSPQRSWLPASAAPLGRFLRSHKRLSIVTSLLLVLVVLAATLVSQGTLSAVFASSALNNEGATVDNATSAGNFDGQGSSYSQTLLTADGFSSGGTVTVGGLSFTWPTVASGTLDNWTGPGQVIPLASPTSGTTLGLIGSASNGIASGTATVTYTDSSTQTFPLTFSDWTLGGGKLAPALGDTIVAQMPYRNLKSGSHQNTKTYLFYIQVTVNAAKTVQSLTLPTSVSGGQLHVFAMSVGAPTQAGLLNNGGLSSDSAISLASFDGQGSSFSQTLLSARGFSSGGTVTVGGLSFTWPKVASGAPDNWMSAGQTLPLASPTSGTTLGLIGSASNGIASGTATVTYTDSSTQSFPLTFSDWTLKGGKVAPALGDTIVAQMPYRNTHTGHQTINNYIFYTQVALNPSKTVASLTLPSSVTGGQQHVFAFSVGSPAAAGLLNNEGSSSDAATSAGNFDGQGSSFSQTALAGYGFLSGSSAPVMGISFTWPKVASGTLDNWMSAGQTLPLPTPESGTRLGLIGSASNGVASGTATVTYTDSSTQSFPLTFSDWTLGGGKLSPASGDTIVAKMSYRNIRTGHQTINTYMFYTSVALDPTKTVQSLTLPGSVTGGQLHVFAFAVLSPSANSDWTEYLGGAAGTGFNGAETTITPANVSGLTKQWTTTGQTGISAQPIVVSGNIYWGDWNGVFHDTPVGGGTDTWDVNLGLTTDKSCNPNVIGIGSSAAYAVVNGTPTIYVGGGGNDSTVGKGNVYLYAINASTGAIIWQTVVGSSPHDFAWSSPVLYNGSVYYGEASLGDCPLTRGRIYKMDAGTGAIQGTFYTEPANCTAGGIWGTPTIDASTGMMYTATGTQSSCWGQPGDYSASVVEINANTMQYVASWQIPKAQLVGDSDFGSAPVLFTATINGKLTQMTGVANKNGLLYAFDRTQIAKGPLWEDQVAIGGSCPQCGIGAIAPGVWDGRVLYISEGNTTINGQSCVGGLRAINPATGAYLWQDCLPGADLGAEMGSPGVIFVNEGSTIAAFNAGDGKQLFSYTDTGTNSVFWSAPVVADGQVFDGNMDGTFYAFGL